MDVSGVGASSITALTNTATQPATETGVAMQKKMMEMQKEMAAQLISSIEQSAPKPKASGPIGGNIDVMA
ncbi:MAG: putative motility protein [Candidatus Thiodiazotropha sp.]